MRTKSPACRAAPSRGALLALAVLLALPAAALAGAEEIEGLLKQIASGDRGAVDRAVARLSYLGAGRAVGEELGQQLLSPAPQKREAAAYALASLPAAAQAAVPPLLHALSDDLPVVRAQAATALGRAGVKKAGRALGKAASDPNGGVRRAALAAMATAGDPKDKTSVAAVQAGLADADLEVRAAACDAAGGLKLAAARPKLAEALAGSDLIRPAAARALLRLGAPEGRAYAEQLLGGDDASRADGARLLEVAAEPWARDRLKALLLDAALPVRTAAARSLSRQGDELALAFLVVGAETSPDAAESLAYARALDELGVPESKRRELKKKHLPAPAPRK